MSEQAGHGTPTVKVTKNMTVIEIQDVTKRFKKVAALDGVSLTIERQEIFGILGRNGAGKSTLVDCIVGLTQPDSGQISVLGLEPGRDRTSIAERVGVQLQQNDLPEKLRVREALRLYASFYDNPADVDELLDLVDLSDKRRTFWEDLSGGQQQRVAIALALVGNPEVAILDELTTGLDPVARRSVWTVLERLREGGMSIILISHFMDEVEALCNRVAILDRGRVVGLDTPRNLVAASGGEQMITFTVTGHLDLERLGRGEDVMSVTRRADTVVVSGRSRAISTVTDELRHAGIPLSDLQVRQPGLESAFTELTGRPMDEDGTNTLEDDR